MASGHGRSGSAAKAAGTDAALGGPEDPAGDVAAVAEYKHSRDSGGDSTGGGSRGVLLAIAIVLLWLAGFAFFIAFEGAKLLGEQADTSGAGLLKAMIGGLAARAQAQEQGGT